MPPMMIAMTSFLVLCATDREIAVERGAIGEQRRARCGMDHGAALEHDGRIGDRQDTRRVLLHEDGREALLSNDATQRAKQLLDDERGESFERLVEKQHARVQHERPSDGEHLLFAAGKLCAEVAPPLRQARKHREHALGRVRAAPRDRRQVLFDAQRLEDVPLLRHPADARRRALVGPQVRDVRAGEHDASGPPPRHADQRAEQRGLARAVATQKRERLPLAEREVNVVDHHCFGIPGPEALDPQELRHGSLRRDTRPSRGDRARCPPARLARTARR
jgi:hypothetical protein